MKLPSQRISLLVLLLSAYFSALSLMAINQPVYAAGTEVVVRLCSLTPQPLSVSVSQPQTDTVVSQSQVSIIGQADQQAQLDVYLNDVHNSALSTQLDGSFTTSVKLILGTNTIKITGASFCGGLTDTIHLILTYIPPDTPTNSDGSSGSHSPDISDGAIIATQVPGISYRTYGLSGNKSTGVIINPSTGTVKINPPSQDESDSSSPLDDYLSSILSNDYVKRTYDIIGILLIIGGATAISTALRLAGIFAERKLSLLSKYKWQIVIGSLLLVIGLVIVT